MRKKPWRLQAAMRSALLMAGLAAPSALFSTELGSTAHAGTWTTQLSAEGPTQFSSLSCANFLVCTAVGGGPADGASIYRTTDGGATWTRQHAPAGVQSLSSVSCPTTSFCLAESYLTYPLTLAEVTYVSTTDGGAVWSGVGRASAYGSPGPLHCASPTLCYQLNTLESGMEQSTDGGKEWTTLSMPFTVDDMSCVHSISCAVVGPSATSTSVVEFARIVGDSAEVIDQVALPRATGADEEGTVSCSTLRSCTVMEGGTGGFAALTTRDFGAKWALASHLPPSITNLRALSCGDPKDCLALSAGVDPSTLIAVTTDDDWATRSASTIASAPDGWSGTGLSCHAGGRCFVAGAGLSDDVLLSRDGKAAAWRTTTLPDGTAPLTEVACPTTSSCLALGTGVALVSGDDGATWSPATTPPSTSVQFDALTCPTSSTCLGGVASSSTSPSPLMYRTTDGGMTWASVTIATASATDLRINSIACMSASDCVATTNEQILATSDGGAIWEPYATEFGSLDSVSCGSSSDCVAVGFSGDVVATTDGGATWAVAATVETAFGGVSCTTATVCFASGIVDEPGGLSFEDPAAVYESTDDGQQWSQVGTPTGAGGVGGISCQASSCQVFTSGPYNSVLETSNDEGVDWTQVSLPASMLFDAASNASGGWIVVGGDEQNGAFVSTSP